MSRPEDSEDRALTDAVGVDASFRAKQLYVKTPPHARVIFEGNDGRETTRRVGIPPTGTQSGHGYRDVSVRVNARGRLQKRR
jgi:hypothetical protein